MHTPARRELAPGVITLESEHFAELIAFDQFAAVMIPELCELEGQVGDSIRRTFVGPARAREEVAGFLRVQLARLGRTPVPLAG